MFYKIHSGSVKKILGRERVDEALMSIYNGVQHKTLNKQLVYTLLDILLGEILSEFKELVKLSTVDKK